MQQYGSLIVAAIRADREKLDRNYSAYVYYENHHIRPKCFGRDDRDENLVLLTFAEHVEAHVLLAKLYPPTANFSSRLPKCWRAASAGKSLRSWRPRPKSSLVAL